MNAGPLDDLPRWAIDLLDDARVGHLGLIDDRDHPRVLPVTFTSFEGALWSAIDRKPKRATTTPLARIRYLRRRPQAALTVDRYDDDWSKLAWVQVLGRVEIAEAADHVAALDALRAKYDAYRDCPPPGPLLRLVCERALCWLAHQ